MGWRRWLESKYNVGGAKKEKMKKWDAEMVKDGGIDGTDGCCQVMSGRVSVAEYLVVHAGVCQCASVPVSH